MAEKRVVVADGEATGHKHVATGDEVTFLTDSDKRLLNAPQGATVTHEEHGTIGLPADKYRVSRIKEFNYDEARARQVLD